MFHLFLVVHLFWEVIKILLFLGMVGFLVYCIKDTR